MKTLNKKLGKNSGFTLIEMLIVVAIIAILIAIGIPLANSALERTRQTADNANKRAALAEAIIAYSDQTDRDNKEIFTFNKNTYSTWYVIDGDQGKLMTAISDQLGVKGKGYGQSSENAGKYVMVTITGGQTETKWVDSVGATK